MSESVTAGVDRDEYARFIEGVELRIIWLAGAEIKNIEGPQHPERIHIRVADGGTEWDYFEGWFRIHQTYLIRFEEEGDGRRLGEITTRFGLEYTCAVQPTDAQSHAFSLYNVPLNVWPYFREFVSNATGRMGWQPLTIPAFKGPGSWSRDPAWEEPAAATDPPSEVFESV